MYTYIDALAVGAARASANSVDKIAWAFMITPTKFGFLLIWICKSTRCIDCQVCDTIVRFEEQCRL